MPTLHISGDVSEHNITTDTLTSGATFTGQWERNFAADVMVSCHSSSDGTLYFDFSPDGVNVNTFPVAGFEVYAGIHEFHTAVKGPRYFRIRFVNSAVDQTYFRLFVYYGTFRQGNLPFAAKISDDADAIAVRTDSEEEVMKGRVAGQYIIPKFGRNPDIDGVEDIWNGGGDYTGFPTGTAEEFQVFSSDVNDTAGGTGAQATRWYYLDDDYNMFDASGNYLYFDVPMSGTTSVNTGTTGMRIWRGLVTSSGSGQTNAGNITARWRTTTSAIFAVMPIGFAQTDVSNFTIPAGYVGYLKRYSSSMDDNTANSANLAIKVRDFGSNTFRLIRPFVVGTDRDYSRTLYGGEKFEEKTDFCFRCTNIANANGIITVSYGILLVEV